MAADPEMPTESGEYSHDYFLTDCDGHSEYVASKGIALSERMEAVWHFLRVRPQMSVLDVGCGRGELTVRSGLAGADAVGIDYSTGGICLARKAIRHAESLNRDTWRRPHLTLGNVKLLPFQDGTFDRAVMSDVVEHLYPDELQTALEEVHRVLAPGGALLIHTMPNLWYYRIGYPLFRVVQRMRGTELPADPRARFRYSHVHVNEQTPLTLRKTLASSSFAGWRVWLYDYRTYASHSQVMRSSMRLLTTLPLVKWAFCDDIFALAFK